MYICTYVCISYVYLKLCGFVILSIINYMNNIMHYVYYTIQDNISDSVITKIQPYIDNEDFQPAAIFKVSLNAVN